ncbi:hypothetical protein [Acutalibacter sp. JLR.KK004]|uniref:hypothetical protein n=1 Tax=Acutalibacter sp. JLR.KK004 TaxID=3112622 RepID=UPI002FF0F62B
MADLCVKEGVHLLGPTGLPRRVEGLEELLQNAGMRIALRRGEFPYGRELGSGFWQWDSSEEHALERAAALANEGLLDMPGVRAVGAREVEAGVAFQIDTPLGKGEVVVWRASQES